MVDWIELRTAVMRSSPYVLDIWLLGGTPAWAHVWVQGYRGQEVAPMIRQIEGVEFVQMIAPYTGLLRLQLTDGVAV